MGEVAVPLMVAIWLLLAVAIGSLALGLLPAAYLLWRREAQMPPDVAAAERDVVEINRAAQRAMLFDALRRGSRRTDGRARVSDPFDGEWYEGHG